MKWMEVTVFTTEQGLDAVCGRLDMLGINQVMIEQGRESIEQFLHDTAKYGMYEYDKAQYKNHAMLAADHFAEWCYEIGDFYKPSEFLLNAIAAHMGQWSTEKEDRPFTNIDRCVHMADYMASRSFIDIPSITEEWHNVEMEMVVAGELPF